MKRKLKKVLQRNKNKASKQEVSGKVPRITNDTVAEHREQVLSSARKYIYPLQHSKHRIVIISIGVLIAAIIVFFSYCTLALYRLQNNSTFLYRVTQVIPFPVARIGSQLVAYENYLFELRHYTHYYETQLKVDFSNEGDKAQLDQFKQRALDKVVNDAYVKQLADRHGVSVTNQEVDAEIELVRSQNRLGSDEQVLEDVIKDYWGWTLDDFKRTLRQQLLAHKVVATLDTETHKRAEAALTELKNGADFAAVAEKYSDDQTTKTNGGEFGFPIDKTSRELSAKSIVALFNLKPGTYSEIIDTGYSLEILKNVEENNDKIRAARIVFNYKPIEDYINDLKAEQPARVYISLPEPPEIDQPQEPGNS